MKQSGLALGHLFLSMKQLVRLARPSHLNAGGTGDLAIGWDGLAS